MANKIMHTDPVPSKDNPAPTPPRWINGGLIAAALLALGAAGAALYVGWSKNTHNHGLIADLSYNLGGREVREHCTTCHVEGGLPSPGPNAAAEPHPDISPHVVENLGCTGCHLGEGMAMDRALSHGLPGLGARQVLTGRDVQGRCYACHLLDATPLAGAERPWQGYQLFREKACGLCHHIGGLATGGHFGPDLSHIGSQLGLEQLHTAIRDPRSDPPNSIMPRFPLSRSQVRDLAWFLKSRVADPYYATPMQVQAGKIRLPEVSLVPDDVDLLPDEDLLYRGKCLACHQFRDEDGYIAPDLTYAGRMRSEEFIREFLERPTRLIPGAIMPPSPLDAQKRDTLATFLAREATSEPEHPHAKHLYMHLCQRCHAADGGGHGPIEPNLATFPRAFSGNAEFYRRSDDERLVRSVERGIAGTSMPPYADVIDKAAREDLLDLIFAAFIGIERQDKTPLPLLPTRPQELSAPQQTDALYARHCLRCHGRTGSGKGPEYLDHLPRPRNLTNRPYFAAQSDEQVARAIADGVSGTAMDAFRDRLQDRHIWDLVDRVRTLSGGEP
ncbi:c-type cytochrome [Geoalkalibacter halelectricus]|uniref:c-type cytochrome n=1 Tax=Geoalkalibacter halelectricus TaxID=2847045 RepID=UPI00266F71C1|nr:c-type cytochrome [Geoalkalibacter halelectricus]